MTPTAAVQGYDENADKALLEKQSAQPRIGGGGRSIPNAGGVGRGHEKMQSYGTSAAPEQFSQIRAYCCAPTAKPTSTTLLPKTSRRCSTSARMADGLVTYRQQNGSFKTLDDLKKVPGLDAAKVDARKARVSFYR